MNSVTGILITTALAVPLIVGGSMALASFFEWIELNYSKKTISQFELHYNTIRNPVTGKAESVATFEAFHD